MSETEPHWSGAPMACCLKCKPHTHERTSKGQHGELSRVEVIRIGMRNVAASVTDIGSGVEVRAVTDAGLPSHGPKRALARLDVRSSLGGFARGGHS